jgi:hypothetical protein
MNDEQTRARFESLLPPLMNHAYNLGVSVLGLFLLNPGGTLDCSRGNAPHSVLKTGFCNAVQLEVLVMVWPSPLLCPSQGVASIFARARDFVPSGPIYFYYA